MESSGEQALIIGVNVFILIVALTGAIMLMTSVLDISTLANTVIKTTANSSLMSLYGETTERIYTGEQVLAVAEEYLSPTTNMKYKYNIYIVNGEKQEVQVAITEERDEKLVLVKNSNLVYNEDMLKSTYLLRYYGKETEGLERDIYKFEKIQ